MPASAAEFMARETLMAEASRSPRMTTRKVVFAERVTLASPSFFAAASALVSYGSSGYTLSSIT